MKARLSSTVSGKRLVPSKVHCPVRQNTGKGIDVLTLPVVGVKSTVLSAILRQYPFPRYRGFPRQENFEQKIIIII